MGAIAMSLCSSSTQACSTLNLNCCATLEGFFDLHEVTVKKLVELKRNLIFPKLLRLMHLFLVCVQQLTPMKNWVFLKARHERRTRKVFGWICQLQKEICHNVQKFLSSHKAWVENDVFIIVVIMIVSIFGDERSVTHQGVIQGVVIV